MTGAVIVSATLAAILGLSSMVAHELVSCCFKLFGG